MTRSCDACGLSLGANPECPTCVRSYIRAETGKDGRESWSAKKPRRGEVWLMMRGRNASRRLVGRLKVMIGLVRDHYTGAYTRTPGGAVFWGAFAIAYVVAAIDLIPDLLPLVGLLDDALVIGLIVKAYARTIGDYCRANRLDPAEHGLI